MHDGIDFEDFGIACIGISRVACITLTGVQERVWVDRHCYQKIVFRDGLSDHWAKKYLSSTRMCGLTIMLTFQMMIKRLMPDERVIDKSDILRT